MKKILRVVGVLTIILLLFMVWGWFNIWRSPAYYTLNRECEADDAILSMEEYAAFAETHPRPFLVSAPSLLIFGAEHSRNEDDPQMRQIEESWRELEPTVALVEGRLGFLIPYLMNPIEKFGESGLVADLAKASDAEIYSWELPESDLILKLVESYPPEQVALHQILTPYFSNYRYGKPDDPNAFVEPFLNRSGYPGLNNVISSVAEIDRIWQRDFEGQPDWRETSDQFGLPGYLADIGSSANLIRNQHLACVIIELIASGERVIVICGSSHAVCLAPLF